MPSYEYEPDIIYQQRQPLLNERGMLQQAIDTTTQTLGDIGGAIGTGLSQGLEWALRPGQATLGAISGTFPRAGGPQSIEQGFMQGLTGQLEKKDWSGELTERFGEMGKLSVPNTDFSVTGSQALGLAADIVVDPLNLIPFGPAAKMVRGGEVATGALKTMADIKPLSVEEGIQQVSKGGIISKVVHTPVVGRIMKPLASLISPAAATDNEFLKAVSGYNKAKDDFSRVNIAMTAPLETHPGLRGILSRLRSSKPSADDVDDMDFVLTNGAIMKMPDVMESYSDLGVELIGTAEYDWIEKAHGVVDNLMEYAHQHGVSWNDAEPWTEGWSYFPRQILREAKKSHSTLIKETEIKPFMDDRAFITAEQGALDGEVYKGNPLAVLRWHIDNVLQAVADKQLDDFVVDSHIAQFKDVVRISDAKAFRDAMRQRQGDIREFSRIVRNAAKGARVSPATIDKYSEQFPELVAKLHDAMSIKTDDVARVVREMSGDIRKQLGVTSERFMSYIRDERNPRFTERNTKIILNKMGRSDKAAIDTIEKVYKKAYQDFVGNRKSAFKEILDTVTPMGKARTAELKDASEQLKIATSEERAKVRGMSPGGELVPMFRNMYFNKDELKVIEQQFGKVSAPIQKISNANALARTLSTSFDLSAPFIQGLVFMVSNPVGWAKGAALGARTLFQPEALLNYISKPETQDIIARSPGLILHNPEMFEATGMIRQAGQKLGVPGKAFSNAIDRFQASFDAFGDYARVEMMKGLLPTAERLGNVDDIVEFVNRATGAMSMRGLGISPTQAAIEGSFMMFAPRYTRAFMFLMGDVLQGGLSFNESQKAIANMLTAGTLFYAKTAYALGQEPVLDPTDSKFGTLQIGNDTIGIGGIWQSALRMFTRAASNPESLLQGEADNPIIQFARSRLSPFGSVAADKVLFGETYIGEPLDTPVDLMKYVGSKYLPFALDAYIGQVPQLRGKIGQNPPQDIESIPFQLLGMRVSPQSRTERLDRLAKENYGRTWDELNAFEQADLQKLPDVAELPVPAGKRGERIREQERINQGADTQIEQYVSALRSGKMGPSDFRKLYSDVVAERSVKLSDLDERIASQRDTRANSAYGMKFDALTFDQQKALEKKYRWDALADRDRMRRKYYFIMRQKTETGAPDFEGAEEYYASLPKDVQLYIDQKQLAGTDLPEVRALIKARKTLKSYWDVMDNVMASQGVKTRFRHMNLAQQNAFKKTQQYKDIQREVAKQRKQLRSSNQTIDSLLVKWYDYTEIA